MSGRAKGVVVATGSETELGRINQLLVGVGALETPLLRQIKKFGNAITSRSRGGERAGLRLRQVGARAWTFVEIFQAVVGIAVSVIPEGLPAIITITLAIGVQRMAQRNAIIRRLPAVETLGSVSRICSDKTGTLTLMEMMVVSAVTAEADISGNRGRLRSQGEIKKDGKPAGNDPVLRTVGAGLYALQRCGAVPTGRRLEGGGRSDGRGALPVCEQTRDGPASRTGAVSADRRHSIRIGAPLHGDAPQGSDGKQFLLVKGAPEVILDHCDRQLTSDGQQAPIDRGHFAGRRTNSPAKASASWRWRGSTILASGTVVLPPRTYRKLWFCSGWSACSIRRVKKLSRRSRNVIAVAFASQ